MMRSTFNTAALIILLGVSLSGCVGDYGYAYDYGPEWDGTVYVGDGGYYRSHRDNVFRGDGGRHPIGVARGRGRASIGSRGAGGGGQRR